jgi:hypothetical protein
MAESGCVTIGCVTIMTLGGVTGATIPFSGESTDLCESVLVRVAPSESKAQRDAPEMLIETLKLARKAEISVS